MKKYAKLLSLVSIVLCFVIFILFFTVKVDFSTSDLGRHLTNGRIFFENFTIIHTNYYSYTEPDFPVVTHHWGSGVIFYLLYKMFGVDGLSVFFTFTGIITLFFFYEAARKRTGVAITSLIFLFFLPLITARTEIRPEVFSYLLSGVFYFLLLKFRENRLSFGILLLLPLLMVFWANLHIYFFLGNLIIGAFLIEAIIRVKGKLDKYGLYLLLIFMLTYLATLLTPFGMEGAVAPYKIFQNYGYKVLENQSVWYLGMMIKNDPTFAIFKIAVILFALSFVAGWYRRRDRLLLADLVLGMVFAGMSIMAIRNFTIFALFSLPIVAANIRAVLGPKILMKVEETLRPVCAGLLVFVFLLTISGSLVRIFPKFSFFGIGLLPGINDSAEFFKKEGLKGPIFNNYDIGGYLIFHLFPKEKVFVDNRPEAYSIDFFQKIYIPMQNDEENWKEMVNKYNLNTIYFQRWEMTNWSADFLVRRVNDPEWVPVFADLYTVILVRKNSDNAEIIKKFELPKENFRLIPRTK